MDDGGFFVDFRVQQLLRLGVILEDPLLMERTLILLKPDAVRRAVTGRIISRFEDALMKIVGMKMKRASREEIEDHYRDLEERSGSEIYESAITLMLSGPLIALAVEGFDAVKKVRAMVGSTFPGDASPGTIRGDFGHCGRSASEVGRIAVPNLVHASSSREEAVHEITLWFADHELCDYRLLAECS